MGTSEFSFNPAHDYITDRLLMTQGEQMQADLGLSKFRDNVFIQKVLGYATPIYVVTFNSRYHRVGLSASKVKKLKSTWLGKVTRKAIHIYLGNAKLTPPLILASSLIHPTTGSLIVMRDIAGEYMRNKKAFECVEENNKLKLKEFIL